MPHWRARAQQNLRARGNYIGLGQKRAPLSLPGGQPGDAFAERLGLGEQAHHQVGLGFEVEEEARLNQDSVLFEQGQGPFLLGHYSRHSHYGVPAALDFERLAGGSLTQGGAKRGQVRRGAPKDLLAHQRPDGKQLPKGVLDRSAHGKIGVGDQFQPLEGLPGPIAGGR